MMVSAAARRPPPAPQIKRARQSVQHRRRPIDFRLEEGRERDEVERRVRGPRCETLISSREGRRSFEKPECVEAIGLPLLNRHHRPSWQVHDNRSNWGAKKGNISFGVVGRFIKRSRSAIEHVRPSI